MRRLAALLPLLLLAIPNSALGQDPERRVQWLRAQCSEQFQLAGICPEVGSQGLLMTVWVPLDKFLCDQAAVDAVHCWP